ncbi:acid protease, partial [Aulographum hederae CBS 113979]
PAPIAFAPDQNWEGIDGTWNTFTIGTGTPPQYTRVLISTTSQQTWVVLPAGCPGDPACFPRGYSFNYSLSQTWDPIGTYDFYIEKQLGYEGNAAYGYDTVSLGGYGEGGPSLPNMTVGAFAVESFWFGHFGLHPKPTNFTNFTDGSPSYMHTLKEQDIIPSVSFAYTAGAQYRYTSILASLTLGGYDSSRFIPNNLTFDFAPDNERELVVGIQKIGSHNLDQQEVSLMPTPAYAFIDSTVPQIWLPEDACRAFEEAFGLTYDTDTELYLLNDTTHTNLQTLNPNVTITLGVDPSGGETIDIVMPYSSFDLVAKSPYQDLQNDTRYFPLRRALNSSMITLGRAFLQEAYLIVDWERQNFSVSQCSWLQGQQQKLVPILPPEGSSLYGGTNANAPDSTTSSHGLTTGAIVGVAVGIVVAALVGAIIAFVCFRRRKQKHQKLQQELLAEVAALKSEKAGHAAEIPPATDPTTEPKVFPKHELDATSAPRAEIDSESKKPITGSTPLLSPGLSSLGEDGKDGGVTYVAEADTQGTEVFEMPGDMPARQEADGRQLSEKETMLVREARYNGPGAVSPVATTPLEQEGGQNAVAGARKAPVNAEDVV